MAGKRATYRIQADHDGLQMDIDERFWADEITLQDDGTTTLDFNIACAVEEIRAILYYVATGGTRH